MTGRGKRAWTAPERHGAGWSLLRWLRDVVIMVVVIVAVLALVRVYVAQQYIVPSGSMENTLQRDDRILAWRPGDPVRGQIVVFRDDLGWLDPAEAAPWWKQALATLKVLPPTNEKYLVKRLIGLPGDHVRCCDTQGRITVNGQPLDESSYVFYTATNPTPLSFDLTVPAGRIFVLGDHRDNSADSSIHLCSPGGGLEAALPPLSSIQGGVVATFWPFNRARTFEVPATFNDVPAAATSPPALSDVTWSC